MKTKLKKLYRKTATGKIQMWQIWVEDNVIYSRSGQLDGKKTTFKDVIKAGKNIGKKTETTKEEQAVLEARAKWGKQKKKGYVNSIEDAEADMVDKSVIGGGYFPMLAKVYEKAKKHIEYPCAVQPKLNGIRGCLDSGPQFYSRTRKPINAVPHIVKALKKMLSLQDLKLDGELYNHDYKKDFEKISSAVRKEKELHPDHELIQYHVYDVNHPGKTFRERMEMLNTYRKLVQGSPIIFVETQIADTPEELMELYEMFMEQGYEGAMVRNLDSPYESVSATHRSKHLQKIKVMVDDEFKVVGIIEGRGKLAGHVGSFVCEINDERGKRTFDVKLKGKLGFLKDCFEDESLWKGKLMTVQFQNYSKKNYKPIFPVGLRFRDINY